MVISGWPDYSIKQFGDLRAFGSQPFCLFNGYAKHRGFRSSSATSDSLFNDRQASVFEQRALCFRFVEEGLNSVADSPKMTVNSFVLTCLGANHLIYSVTEMYDFVGLTVILGNNVIKTVN